ncbi:MAG: DUF3592 domain-containing protein [Alphaproteobacteria bacterium]|nr:DUF3592 domain-containing protein [Alphaproteobacteria bacterium]MBV9902709.1 DUF3592 domain-containing protein [Alphaproteobacteria bacterium]
MPVGLILIGLVWFGALTWAHFRAVGKAKAAETWPTAQGRVAGCEVVVEESSDREGGTTTWYNPVVSYAYNVGGRDLTGNRLRFGNYRSASRRKAEACLTPYPVGGTIPVRYNPDRPEECVLETRRPGPIYLVMAVFGLLFVGMGIFWLAMG